VLIEAVALESLKRIMLVECTGAAILSGIAVNGTAQSEEIANLLKAIGGKSNCEK